MHLGCEIFLQWGTQFAINDIPIFLRGTLECAIFPKTGYPPTDKKEWARIFSTIKSFGLNHVRFHSWCPPEAAFNMADSLGVYLQIECSSWANWGTGLGDGAPLINTSMTRPIELLIRMETILHFVLWLTEMNPEAKIM